MNDTETKDIIEELKNTNAVLESKLNTIISLMLNNNAKTEVLLNDIASSAARLKKVQDRWDIGGILVPTDDKEIYE